jgi:hypothetical protein
MHINTTHSAQRTRAADRLGRMWLVRRISDNLLRNAESDAWVVVWVGVGGSGGGGDCGVAVAMAAAWVGGWRGWAVGTGGVGGGGSQVSACAPPSCADDRAEAPAVAPVASVAEGAIRSRVWL